ncbi:MAG: hypothetical protein U0525_03390 [Patescibacteria group bacterium]
MNDVYTESQLMSIFNKFEDRYYQELEIYKHNVAAVKALSEDNIVFASSRQEAYGCVFGRDTAITCIFLLDSIANMQEKGVLEIVEASLKNLMTLQGKDFVLESGEEPGKVIHEYRIRDYERLINRQKPWYVYPDGILRNYDSIDSTPLALIAIYRLIQISKTKENIDFFIPLVKKSLNWLLNYSDSNKDGLVDYELKNNRTYGGLSVQSWTDSFHIFGEDLTKIPTYPIAPLEVQAIAWYAAKCWSSYFKDIDSEISHTLTSYASKIKLIFVEKYLANDNFGSYLAQAIDGKGNTIKTLSGNIGFVLYFSIFENEYLIDHELAEILIKRLFSSDMYHPQGGIRTMSKLASLYDPSIHSYHNGSFWPMLNTITYLGLIKYGHLEKAKQLYEASMYFYTKFNSPLELYIIDAQGNFREYVSKLSGKKGCRYQAWSAAGLMCMISWHKKLLLV